MNLSALFGVGPCRPTTKLPVLASGANATVIVGNEEGCAVLSITGATINSFISSVTDIDDPAGTGGWTDIVSFMSSSPFIVEVTPYPSNEDWVDLQTTAAEAATKSLRAQIVVDDTVIADGKITSDGSNTGWVYFCTKSGSQSFMIYCNSSFVFRAARNGDFADSNSKFQYGAFTIREL